MKKQVHHFLAFQVLLVCVLNVSFARPTKKGTAKLHFTISAANVASQKYAVTLQCDIAKDSIDFIMPAWTTGYYQLMNFAQYVSDFSATNSSEKSELKWKLVDNSTWRIYTQKKPCNITYSVAATKLFVASNFLSESKGYVSPAGVCMYPGGFIQSASTVELILNKAWKNVATGLEKVPNKPNNFYAENFDVLYDSPILMGNLDSLPSFTVKGVPHYFVGADMGNFDHQQFIEDLQEIVAAAVDVIGDIPYKSYTFIAIGPGGGGIEHLNSTSISFSGQGLDSKQGRLRMYSFLAHEYFHHYNVKRIRPIELGPFDYTKENPTNMLWVSEGLSVYYEYLILNRAGLMTREEMLQTLQHEIVEYEKTPGRFFQTLTQASLDTWSDGPFGRKDDEVNKTISYYNKGPIVGTMLDFAIRNHTGNKKTLDDVMRYLYRTYYQQKKRGFTEAEFNSACELQAGHSLQPVFDYINTVKSLDYPGYFNLAGLQIDTTTKVLSGTRLGISTRAKNDTISLANVEWQSPAWEAGIRRGDILISINDSAATDKMLTDLTAQSRPGDKVVLTLSKKGTTTKVPVTLDILSERKFTITQMANSNELQTKILNSWARP
jgi:predicted metalloprotease with PDZ domain